MEASMVKIFTRSNTQQQEMAFCNLRNEMKRNENKSTHQHFWKSVICEWKYANNLQNRNLYFAKKNYSETQENKLKRLSQLYFASKRDISSKNMLQHLLCAFPAR